jgi:hypothetical protein
VKPIPHSLWPTLPTKLAEVLKARLESPERVQFTVRDLQDGSGIPIAEVRVVLDGLVASEYLQVVQSRRCVDCQVELNDDDIARQECACGATLHDAAAIQETRVYIRDAPLLRDIRWAVAVHGMNTPGSWQQDFSWRLAQMYGYSIPVAIYKYGNIKLSPFLPHRQKAHRDRLLRYLRGVRDEMRGGRYGERPDVIAHSFGTWLIAEALRVDTGADALKLGRVILTGSIVRPDFEWWKLVEEGRVEAVLCHCALRDGVVPLAHYFIAGSGPSGTRGFNDSRSVAHVVAPRFGHSDYFAAANLAAVMRDVWGPFLRAALNSGSNGFTATSGEPPWKPNPLRFVARLVKAALVISLGVLAAIALVSSAVGVTATLRQLFSYIGAR